MLLWWASFPFHVVGSCVYVLLYRTGSWDAIFLGDFEKKKDTRHEVASLKVAPTGGRARHLIQKPKPFYFGGSTG